MRETKTITKQELDFICAKGEGLQIEFKESIKPSIARELVAMANAFGGRIFVGITDNGHINSIKSNNRLFSQIQDIANNCHPAVSISIEAVHDILIVHVPEGIDKPYQCKDGFFLRTGANSQKLDRNQLIDFLQAEGKIRYEEQFNRKFIFEKHYNSEKLNTFLRIAGITKNLEDKAILENLGVGCFLDERFTLNNAGVLFFSQHQDVVCEYSTITCAVFEGTERISVMNRKDYCEDIIQNIEDTMRFVKNELRVKYEMTGQARRKNIYEIPLDAVREAIVNAVSHRDYLITGAHSIVEIFDDRMEISNPGGLVNGLTPDQFGKRSIRRNQIISSLLHRANYMENMGTGINKIKKLLKSSNVPACQFEFRNFFSIIFPRPENGSWKVSGKNVGKKVSGKDVGKKIPEKDLSNEVLDNDVGKNVSGKNVGKKVSEKNIDLVLKLLKENSKLSIPDLAIRIGVTERTIERYIQKLRNSKKIKRIGSTKGGYWNILENDHDAL